MKYTKVWRVIHGSSPYRPNIPSTYIMLDGLIKDYTNIVKYKVIVTHLQCQRGVEAVVNETSLED